MINKAELIERLQSDIETAIECENDLNWRNWIYEEGILITVNEARLIVETLRKVKPKEK
jgi:hypothetical protein